jgi:riboflavin kinase/FMN adenylyltransferase
MLVIEWSEFLKNGLPLGQRLSSMTVGIFDGVHRGHQALIERVISHNTGNAPVVVTFSQNHKENVAGNIQSFRQKTAMFERMGLQITLVIDFTESFRRMTGLDFLEILLRYGKMGFLVIGADFRCGYQLDTDAAAIQRFFASRNIPVEIVPEIMHGSQPISSSRIRSAITGGNLLQAREMLGYPYTLDLAAVPDVVLPPSGEYQVILREKTEDVGTRAALLIEGGTVCVQKPFENSRWQLAEFVIDDV